MSHPSVPPYIRSALRALETKLSTPPFYFVWFTFHTILDHSVLSRGQSTPQINPKVNQN